MKNVVGRIWSLTCVWDRWRITEISGIREKKIRIIRLFMANSFVCIKDSCRSYLLDGGPENVI